MIVIGAKGFLGAALVRAAREASMPVTPLTRDEFDLMSGEIPSVSTPERVAIYCADYYPGLEATARDGEHVRSVNVTMQGHALRFCEQNGVVRLITIGTTCCYPVTDVPLSETILDWVNPAVLNQKMLPYAMSRFTLLAQARTTSVRHHHLILPNFYGPGDRFEPGRSHLLSSWVRDFHQAMVQGDRRIALWGSPDARREFIYIDDAARYVLALATQDLIHEVVNVGTATRPTYGELAQEILDALGYPAVVTWDHSRSNARMAEVLDLRRLARYRVPPATPFRQGVRATVQWYLTRA